jgi:hypothetical protein
MILFKPWVGSEYEKQPLKILIVGESFYGMNDGDYDESFGIKAIEDYLYGKHFGWKKNRFHGVLWNTLKVFLNKDDSKEVYFSRIAFCNYIQDMVADKRRDMWAFIKNNNEIYRQSFLNNIKSLQPHLVILTSARLAPVLEDIGIIKNLNELKILFVSIKHPSGRGYKIIEMQEKVRYVLNLPR